MFLVPQALWLHPGPMGSLGSPWAPGFLQVQFGIPSVLGFAGPSFEFISISLRFHSDVASEFEFTSIPLPNALPPLIGPLRVIP